MRLALVRLLTISLGYASLGSASLGIASLGSVALGAVSLGSAAATAAPVAIRYSGVVEGEYCDYCNGASPFGGFLSVGDQYQAVIQFDPANAIVIHTLPSFASYELVGATASLSINGFEFENYSDSPILAFVSNNNPYDIFAIDIPTVPIDSQYKPLAAGPHGVTEIWLGLQDNSATALATSALPTSNSAIWGAQWQRSEIVSDINGQCLGRGCVNGFAGTAFLTVQTLRATVPEPNSALVLVLGVMIPFRRRR